MVGIVDYNAGNIKSVERALSFLKTDYVLSKNPADLENCDRLIFPGVGEAKYAMEQLKKTGFDSFLRDWVAAKKPLMGICLGSQIIFDYSEEGDVDCLGLLKGTIRHFESVWKENAHSRHAELVSASGEGMTAKSKESAIKPKTEAVEPKTEAVEPKTAVVEALETTKTANSSVISTSSITTKDKLTTVSEQGHFNKLNDRASLKVPHMGWNNLEFANGSSPLFNGVDETSDFYFVHSYLIQPSDESIVKAYADYGCRVPACVSRGSITAFQFHPEKSGRAGLKILENFIK